MRGLAGTDTGTVGIIFPGRSCFLAHLVAIMALTL